MATSAIVSASFSFWNDVPIRFSLAATSIKSRGDLESGQGKYAGGSRSIAVTADFSLPP